jgi:hypothetical protein
MMPNVQLLIISAVINAYTLPNDRFTVSRAEGKVKNQLLILVYFVKACRYLFGQRL